MKTIRFAIPALMITGAFGQTPAMQERVFQVTHTTTVQEFEEVANGVRLITEVRDAATDDAKMSLTIRGTAEQVKLAEWIVGQLDQPVGGPVVPASPEYKGLSGTDQSGHATVDEVARVFYLPHAATVQDFQEALNATRTITEIRRVIAYNDRRAVIARGTPDQIATAGWMLQAMDQATNPQAQATTSSAASEYRLGNSDIIHLFPLPSAKTVQDFQEVANAVRTTTEIRRAFTYSTPRIMAVRGTPDEIAMAGWLVAELSKPLGAQTLVSGDYRVPGAADDVVRVFHLAHVMTSAELQQDAAQIRTTLEIRRVFTYNSERAIALRGTASQMALAENMIRQMEQPR